MSISFDFITDRLATGGAIPPTEADAQAIIDAGITHVIVCNAGEDDVATFSKYLGNRVSVLENGVADDGLPKPVSWFAASIGYALNALAEPGTKVYAHCSAGINRGPSTAYAILRAWGLSRSVAMALIHAARPVTLAGIRYADDADAAVKALGYM